MARIQRPNIVQVQHSALDLTGTAGDIVTTMVVPGDGARLVEVSYTIKTTGVGASANHNLTLEAGVGGAGVAISPVTALDADGAVGLTARAGPLLTGLTGLTKGVNLQVLNAESAAITTGAIVNVIALFAL